MAVILTGPPGRVDSIAFSPDGRRLVGASSGQINVWDVTTGLRLLTLYDNGGALMRVAFSPDGRFLAAATSNQTVKVWDAGMGGR